MNQTDLINTHTAELRTLYDEALRNEHHAHNVYMTAVATIKTTDDSDKVLNAYRDWHNACNLADKLADELDRRELHYEDA